MGIFDGLLARFGYVKAPAAQYPDWLLSSAEQYRQSLVADIGAGNLYAKLTWISTAVDLVASGVAQTSFNVKRLDGENETDIPNHDFERLLRRPNPLQSRGEFLRDWAAWYKLTGNGYVWLNRASESAPPDEMWILPSDRVTPVPDGKLYLKGYVFDSGAAKIPLEPWEVCHVKTFNPRNPYLGQSAIESLMTVSKSDIAQQRWNLALFADDNAKLPGALAFADRIDDLDWETLKGQAREQWGGTKRSGPMMLRGVGAGGVQWVSMAASQKEMEFLESRKFTKEEIWGRLAPGAASILDTNATEANATAGKAVLLEYAIWPVNVQLAEKITNDILPAYGEGLVGEFDDIRETNRLIDLQERSEYSRVHTVNEIRAEYDGESPLPDGDVPIEVWQKGGPSASATPAPAFGRPDMVMGAPEPAAPEPSAPEPEQPEPMAADLAKWQSKAVKAAAMGKPADVRFISTTIPDAEQARIRAGLAAARTVDDVRAVFAPRPPDVLAGLLAELRAARRALEAA